MACLLSSGRGGCGEIEFQGRLDSIRAMKLRTQGLGREELVADPPGEIALDAG